AIASKKIERDRANGCVKKRAIVDVVIAPPKFNESFLINVFGVGGRSRPLPREQDQAGRKLGKANLPIFIGSDILHDLFTVFYNRYAAKSCFCLTPPGFFLALDAGR